ncbi:MAG TPA: MogA/MoaB family molybdenum cofactor biosynthesis protein [Terriglobia bacterium]|nr:MogA/MoaB family molybdenum cofactor biosynthesis protein [Terriglobia bacterium]
MTTDSGRQTPDSRIRRPRAIILTISDSASRGEREDLSGPAAREELETLGCEVVAVIVIPDDAATIQNKLLEHSDSGAIDLIVTTGGTGLAPRDVTPEATLAVVEKLVPGLAELMRVEGMKSNPRAALSRAVAGLRKKTLIINLPGSVRGVQESLAAVAKVLGHAFEVVSGNTVRCGG